MAPIPTPYIHYNCNDIFLIHDTFKYKLMNVISALYLNILISTNVDNKCDNYFDTLTSLILNGHHPTLIIV